MQPLARDAVHAAHLDDRLADVHVQGLPGLGVDPRGDGLAGGDVARHGEPVPGAGGDGGRQDVPPGGGLGVLESLGQAGDAVRSDADAERGEDLHEGLVRDGLGRAVLADVVRLHAVRAGESAQQRAGFQGHRVLHAVVSGR